MGIDKVLGDVSDAGTLVYANWTAVVFVQVHHVVVLAGVEDIGLECGQAPAAGDNLVTGFGIGIGLGGVHKQVFQQPVGGDGGLAQGAELPAGIPPASTAGASGCCASRNGRTEHETDTRRADLGRSPHSLYM